MASRSRFKGPRSSASLMMTASRGRAILLPRSCRSRRAVTASRVAAPSSEHAALQLAVHALPTNASGNTQQQEEEQRQRTTGAYRHAVWTRRRLFSIQSYPAAARRCPSLSVCRATALGRAPQQLLPWRPTWRLCRHTALTRCQCVNHLHRAASPCVRTTTRARSAHVSRRAIPNAAMGSIDF